MKTQLRNTTKGYSLIEMLIVLSILSIILPVVFSIIYVLLNQQIKIYRLIETKRQGDRVLSFMKEKILREAVMLEDSAGTARCQTYTGVPETTTDGQDFIFKKSTDAASSTFNFYVNNNALFIADSDGMATSSIHNTKVRISNFQIECYRRNSSLSATDPSRNIVMIGLRYTVEFIDNTPTTAEGTTSLSYMSKIRLR